MPTAPKFEWPQGQPLFEVQWRAVAESLDGNGVASPGDLAVTATANARELSVAAGTVYYASSQVEHTTSSTLTLSGGDGTYDRWDTIYFDTSTGTPGAREGTPGASPEPPDIQGSEMLLAVVYVPQNATNVPDANVLNWRGGFSNEASQVLYQDSAGVYGVDAVGEALDALTEAAQISQYPLSIATDTEAGAYPLSIGDLASPFSLGTLTDTDLGGSDLTDGATVVFDTSAGAVPQAQQGGPAGSLSGYPLTIGTDATFTTVVTGSLTVLGGSGSSTSRVSGVSTDEFAEFDISVSTDSTTFTGVDYGYSVEWWTEWDSTAGELDVVFQIDWQTDPGAGNDVTLSYTVREVPA